ncbi:arginine/serine-rich coiled-coil protein 2-like isoform X2 [Chironomus tepperi]|uniref:arginine/serine-rich coiled-coil protein 2-like isoform X2 n=1 Tax=Chironomus tepperi TaxID=113505 RepID=UPI00391F8BD2
MIAMKERKEKSQNLIIKSIEGSTRRNTDVKKKDQVVTKEKSIVMIVIVIVTGKEVHEKYEQDNKKSIIAETKKAEIIVPPVDSQNNPVNTIKKLTEDLPSTSTNSDITLPTYYNSSIVNAQKFAEQQKKRKLLWQNKKTEETKWTNLKFSQDNDGTKANKFMRLMGIKDVKEDNSSQPQASTSDSDSNKPDEMLKNMEHQYEVARNITHLSRGFGLGFK